MILSFFPSSFFNVYFSKITFSKLFQFRYELLLPVGMCIFRISNRYFERFLPVGFSAF